MRLSEWQRDFLFGLVVIVLLAPSAFPQASTATVSGTVRDQSNAVIPGASISLTNTATNVTSRTTTTPVGFYIFPGILPGPYRLTVEAQGMQKFEGTLTVQVQQSAVVDPVLKVGQTATEVQVTDVTPLITVDNPTLGHVLERQRIEQLPVNGRFVTTLLQTVPGMELTTTTSVTVGVRTNGSRNGSADFMLDGAVIAARYHGGAVQRPPGLDTLQEFKVETSNSSAKYTRPTTVILSTRSGTNSFHGALFETHRNNAIAKARTRTDFYKDPPKLIRNEFGASAGGPIWIPKVYNGRNRTFWFFGYEGYRNIAPRTMGFSVPTAAMRNGDFRGLVDSQGRQYKVYDPWTTNPQTWERTQFSYGGQPNVIDPALLSPLSKYLYSVTPLPTKADVNPLVEANWFGPVPDLMRQWTITTRVDHRFSEKDAFYARYTQGNQYKYQQRYTLSMLDGVAGTIQEPERPKSLALSWVRMFSPTFFNEFLASGSRVWWRKATGDDVKYADQLGLPNPLSVTGWPGLYDTGIGDYYFETTNTQITGFTYYVFDDNATNVRGKHELQFGFHHRYDILNDLPAQQQNQGNHSWNTGATSLYDPKTARTNPQPTPLTGHNLVNMYLGVMNYSNQFVRGYFYLRAKETALYFQDNYRITQRLSLNIGLRWEDWPAYREKNNVMTTFDPAKRSIILGQDLDTMYRLGATLPSIVNRLEFLGVKFTDYKAAGLPQSLMDGNSRNFGPRLGFAYRLGNGARSAVLRGGYRTSYFPIPLVAWMARMRSNAPLTARFRTSLTDSAFTPDGITNYGMRSTPTIIAGKNSRDAITLGNAQTLTRGSVFGSYFAKEQGDPRIHDWNLTAEKEVVHDTLVRVAYVGNRGTHLDQYYRFNENPPDYVWFATTGLKLPTGEYSNVARRPYDQQVYGTIEEWRKSGWSNYHGMQVELERRYSKGYGFQLFYNVGNLLSAGGQEDYAAGSSVIPEANQFMPGAVPADLEKRNKFLNYQRVTDVPKHRVRWNWIVDLPFGKGKWLGRNTGGALDRLIGGWQIAGMGSLRSNYFTLPSDIYPTGSKIELYGYKYPIQDCRSGACLPGYLWWNGYIPANKINSVDANGKPNGVMGVPSSYKPAGQPLWPWPAQPDKSAPMYSYYGTNTVWVPLKDGTVQRTTFNDSLHPWRQQYLPGVRDWGLDASLFKAIPITERVVLRFNADFFNVLNHPGNPNTVRGDGILSTVESGQPAREVQLTIRLTW